MGIEEEKKAIDLAIDALRKRLHEKADEGFTGWDSSWKGKNDQKTYRGAPAATASTHDLTLRVERSLREGKHLDVASFGFMLWLRDVKEQKEAIQRVSDLKTIT